VHFSGHFHENDTAHRSGAGGFLVNVAVPSPVGFPGGYKIVEAGTGRLRVRTVSLTDAAGFDAAFDAYRAEMARDGDGHGDLVRASGLGDFLDRHLAGAVRHRYLQRDWPDDLAALVNRLGLGDLYRLAGADGEMPPADGALSFLDLVEDWYRLKKGRGLALDFIPPGRLAAWRSLADRFGARRWPDGSLEARIACLMRMMTAYLSGPPSVDFCIDLVDGRIDAEVPAYLGRTERRQTGAA
jgi:hypothetical protein